MKTSLVPAVALSGVLAVGLAGCGSSASPSASSRSTSTQSTSTAVTPSASSSGSATSQAAVGDTIDATELGTRMTDAMAKAKTGRGTVSRNGGTAATTVTGSMQFVFGASTQTQTQGTFTVAGTTLEIVTTGGVVYLKGLPVQMTGGKPWVKIDPTGTDVLSRSLAQLGGSLGDPRAVAKNLQGGKAKVITRRGGLTTYEITGAPGLAGGTMVATIDALDRAVTSTVTTPKATVKVTYTDWGSPVTITVPPADQIGTVPAATATS